MSKPTLWHLRIKPGQTIRTREGLSITNTSPHFSANLQIKIEPMNEPSKKDESCEEKANEPTESI